MSLMLLALSFARAGAGHTMGVSLGGDHAAFYIAGTILNEHSADQLYDLALQQRLYQRLLPHVPASEALPFANPPFVAVLFRPLALLPYAWSYAVWLVLAAGLYLAALAALWRSQEAIPAAERSTALRASSSARRAASSSSCCLRACSSSTSRLM